MLSWSWPLWEGWGSPRFTFTQTDRLTDTWGDTHEVPQSALLQLPVDCSTPGFLLLTYSVFLMSSKKSSDKTFSDYSFLSEEPMLCLKEDKKNAWLHFNFTFRFANLLTESPLSGYLLFHQDQLQGKLILSHSLNRLALGHRIWGGCDCRNCHRKNNKILFHKEHY